MILGLYIDGWAHRHHQIETFFTSWHAILYSGLLAVASLVLVMLYKNRSQGYPWRSTMPVDYGLSLVGLLIFVVGGLGDLIWHEIFGFEHDLEALLSPSHLVLALSGALMVATWEVQPMGQIGRRKPKARPRDEHGAHDDDRREVEPRPSVTVAGNARSSRSATARRRRGGFDSSYVSRMVNLTTMAPNIVAAVLNETLPPGHDTVRLGGRSASAEEEQRRPIELSTTEDAPTPV